MSLYFIVINGQKEGPFTLTELKLKSINRKDLIWKEGDKNWQKAEFFNELSEMFKEVPPPLPTFSKDNIIQKTSNLPISFGIAFGTGFLVLILCFIIFQPFKFNGELYKNAKDVSSTDFFTPVVTDMSEIPNFFDYGDNEVYWNPGNKQACFENREKYLTNKALKYSLIAFIIGFILTFILTKLNENTDSIKKELSNNN